MSERDDLLDVIGAREATIRAQAEQIAALQKALRRVQAVAVMAQSPRHVDESTCWDWFAEIEHDARAALALAEGCAAPAPEEEK